MHAKAPLSCAASLATAAILTAAWAVGGTGSAAAQDGGGNRGCGGLVCDLGLFGLGGTAKERAPAAAPPAPPAIPPATAETATPSRAEEAERAPRGRETTHVAGEKASRRVARHTGKAAAHATRSAARTGAVPHGEHLSAAREHPSSPQPAEPRAVATRQPAASATVVAPTLAPSGSRGAPIAALPLPPGMEAVSNGQALPAPPPPPPPRQPVVLANPYVMPGASDQFQPVDPFYHGEP